MPVVKNPIPAWGMLDETTMNPGAPESPIVSRPARRNESRPQHCNESRTVTPLLLSHYRRLPQPVDGDDWTAGVQDALRVFRDAVRRDYNEGTLARLLQHRLDEVRQGAVLALGLTGTIACSAALAVMLQDDCDLVVRLAQDALWEVWFRGVDPEHSWALQQALQLDTPAEALSALDDLIASAPDYAEAYHQRALVYLRTGDWHRGAVDCRSALRLNPDHFAAAAGLGQCCLRMHRPAAALAAFKKALSIHPGMFEMAEHT
jgi:tetratricopeptide (TPR) repeat protein